MIFDNIIPPTPAAEQTPEQKLQAAKDATTADANALLRRGYLAVVDVHNGLIRLVNKNPRGLTINQVAALLGTRGGAMLQLAGAVQQIVGLIAQVQGVAVPAGTLEGAPAGVTFGVASDGSLTIAQA